MSVIYLEEKSSDEALALIRSAYSSKKHGDMDTLAAKNSGFQPVNHKPNNLESSQRLDA